MKTLFCNKTLISVWAKEFSNDKLFEISALRLFILSLAFSLADYHSTSKI